MDGWLIGKVSGSFRQILNYTLSGILFSKNGNSLIPLRAQSSQFPWRIEPIQDTKIEIFTVPPTRDPVNY